MSSNVQTIYSAMKTLISATLGSDFSELTHTLNLEKNRFDGASKRFGVLPGSANEVPGVTKTNTVSQTFEIILTESYISDNISDDALINKVLVLMGKFDDIYKVLINEKAGVPSVVNVNNLSVDNAVIVSEEKVIVVQASVDIVARVSI